MSQDDKEKLNRIEEMKTKLFSKDYKVKIEHHDAFVYKDNLQVPDSWENDKNSNFTSKRKIFMKTSIFKKFFIFSIIFFIISMGYASYMFLAGGNTVSNDNIDISILGNSFVAGGEELPFQIEIVNKNNSLLELADLVVEYPKGSTGDLSKDTERLRESLGTISPGAIRKSNMKVILFGEQGTTRQIRITLEYRVQGSNAIFVKEKFFDVTISSAPINLSIDAPSEVSPNQEVSLKVKATLNATKATSKILVRLDYPVGFQFISAKPSPSVGNNIWNLGDLSPGAEKEISIIGKMIDVSDGEEKTFHVYSGTQSSSNTTTIGLIFNSLSHTVLIKKAFIEAKLYINGMYQREYAVDAKTSVQGEIRWINNLENKVNDLEITAKISGNALNTRTISAKEGFYNSSKNSIIWDKNSQYTFNEVTSGSSGSVSFSIASLPLFSDVGGIISDPTINIEVSITGKQALDGNSISELKNSESKIVRIISDIGLASKALYYFGPFDNIGPIPPKVENETTYTVSWSLSNTSNNISKTQIRSTFPQWIKFLGVVSPSLEDLTYNPSTKEILWNVGTVKKGTGITEPGREVFFQIALTPSLSQVGQVPIILNNTVLTGRDDFANVDVRVNKASLNTRLPNDTAFPPMGDRVVE
jgi:hypothetical protein